MKEEDFIFEKGMQPVPTISDKDLNFLIGRDFPHAHETVKSKLDKINSGSKASASNHN